MLRTLVLFTVSLSALLPVLAPTARADTEVTRSPVPLYTPQLLSPMETVGSGTAPEVAIRLLVGADGRVEEVEVVSIRPTSDFDEIFRRSTIGQLSTWRYAPALEGGEPVAHVLEMRILYQTSSEEVMAPVMVSGAVPLPDDPASRRASLANLSEAARERLLAEQLSLARAHLVPEQTQRYDTEHFVVWSDLRDPTSAEDLVARLESTFGWLDETLGSRIASESDPPEASLFLYGQTASFARIRRLLRTPENGSFYLGTGLLAFDGEVLGAAELEQRVVHEALHSWVDRYLARADRPLLPWLSEGLADYLAASRIEDGELVPGPMDRRLPGLDHLPGPAFAPTWEPTPPPPEVEGKRKRRRKGKTTKPQPEVLGLAELLAAGPEVFYGPQRLRYARTGWALVHFLRHGEPGWAEDLFADFLLYVVEGYPAGPVIEGVYGRRLAALEEPFANHARGLLGDP